jgi:hypothetical protein
MSKYSIKIVALTLTFIACVSARGMADEWNHDVFTGCVEGGKEAKQKCQNMCGNTYKRTGGYSVQEDTKKCPGNAKPTACYCDYKTEG